jgi:hypothetical protein
MAKVLMLARSVQGVDEPPPYAEIRAELGLARATLETALGWM